MSLGRAPTHEDLYRSTRELCESRLPERSIFRLLAAKAHELFPDDAFADLYIANGRPSIAPRIVSVVMVLQRYSGMSDREAVDAFAFDARWKYAAGALDFDFPGFVHTVLVEMRERLRRSEHPNRIFEAVIGAAREAGLIGRKRVLDSTALYDAVATQDTVTLVRSALVGLLAIVDRELEDEMRSGFERDDDYRKPGKPSCDWDDVKAREALVDALALDGSAALAVMHGRSLDSRVRQAAELLATVLGQDLDQGDDAVFRIARRVAEDRVISTVDPEARHGHKTAARGFDGYKGHISIDPDSELIVTTDVTAGNVGDAAPAAGSTAIARTAPPIWSSTSKRLEPRPTSKCSLPPPRKAILRRMPSPSTPMRRRSPAPTADSCSSDSRRMAQAPQTSARPAHRARCVRNAPTLSPDAPCAPIQSTRRSLAAARGSATPPGSSAIAPSDPRSSARSVT